MGNHLLLKVLFNYSENSTSKGKDITASTIQDKFIQKWALQCGYCTPGFVLNCYALIENDPNANDVEVDEWLDSNICRCTGYQEIKESVKELLRARRAYG